MLPNRSRREIRLVDLRAKVEGDLEAHVARDHDSNALDEMPDLGEVPPPVPNVAGKRGEQQPQPVIENRLVRSVAQKRRPFHRRRAMAMAGEISEVGLLDREPPEMKRQHVVLFHGGERIFQPLERDRIGVGAQ